MVIYSTDTTLQSDLIRQVTFPRYETQHTIATRTADRISRKGLLTRCRAKRGPVASQSSIRIGQIITSLLVHTKSNALSTVSLRRTRFYSVGFTTRLPILKELAAFWETYLAGILVPTSYRDSRCTTCTLRCFEPLRHYRLLHRLPFLNQEFPRLHRQVASVQHNRQTSLYVNLDVRCKD